MNSGLLEVIGKIAKKNRQGDKELLAYIREQDVNMLNQILMYYTPDVYTPIQFYKPALASVGVYTAFISSFILLTMEIYVNKVFDGTLPNYLYTFIFVISIFSAILILQAAKYSKNENKKIKKISELAEAKKILTMIEFVLEEKYTAF